MDYTLSDARFCSIRNILGIMTFPMKMPAAAPARMSEGKCECDITRSTPIITAMQ
jgi:hypothetical protein